MKKPDLILVHSFPTNSILLAGLIEFLEDYFVVHFVDLPGFVSWVDPIGRPSIHNFARYLEGYIDELNLDSYFVGGVSFGFLVANLARLDDRCKGVIAMEPFINTECLSTSILKRYEYILTGTFLELVLKLGLHKKIWYSESFNKYIQKSADYPKSRVDIIIDNIDPKTFFTIAKELMLYSKRPKFHNLPYFLIGNFDDTTINFEKTIEVFVKNVKELHIASEPIEHYPKNLTKEYFMERIPKEHIERLLACLES